MGRAYEVRKASIQKNGAAKGKIYSNYAKEIYLVAKGNPEVDTNVTLKRLVEKAKRAEVPMDIIDRAIKKASSAATDDYSTVVYEVFGPGASTIVIKCLTDNVNRSISDIRAALNKCKGKMGTLGSITYNYDNLSIVTIKSDKEEEILDSLINNGVNVIDYESENGEITVSSGPLDLQRIKDSIEKIIPDVKYEYDETGYFPKDTITLNEEDRVLFDRLLSFLDEIDDVTGFYHNVNL